MSAIRVANVQFDAAATTRIDSPTTNTITINTAGSEAMRIDPAGNIGLGTSSPTARLDVASGNVSISGVNQRLLGDFTNATVSSRMYFQTNVVNNGSIVGVIPNGTGTGSGFTALNNSDPTNAGRITLRATPTSMNLESGVNGSGTQLPLTLHTNNTERARIDTSGNMGINTTNPTFTLDVNGTVRANSITDAATSAILRPLVSTASSSASGTAISFTGIPTWAKRITIGLNAVSVNSAVAATLSVRIGSASGGYATAGYTGICTDGTNTTTNANMMVIDAGATGTTRRNVTCTITNTSGNNWLFTGTGIAGTGAAYLFAGAGNLTDFLDRVQVLPQTPLSANFNGGAISMMYE